MNYKTSFGDNVKNSSQLYSSQISSNPLMNETIFFSAIIYVEALINLLCIFLCTRKLTTIVSVRRPLTFNLHLQLHTLFIRFVIHCAFISGLVHFPCICFAFLVIVLVALTPEAPIEC